MLSANSGLRGCWAQCTLKSVVKAWRQKDEGVSTPARHVISLVFLLCDKFMRLLFHLGTWVIWGYSVARCIRGAIQAQHSWFQVEKNCTSGRKLCFFVTWYNISWVSMAGRISPFNTWDTHSHNSMYKVTDSGLTPRKCLEACGNNLTCSPGKKARRESIQVRAGSRGLWMWTSSSSGGWLMYFMMDA